MDICCKILSTLVYSKFFIIKWEGGQTGCLFPSGPAETVRGSIRKETSVGLTLGAQQQVGLGCVCTSKQEPCQLFRGTDQPALPFLE